MLAAAAQLEALIALGPQYERQFKSFYVLVKQRLAREQLSRTPP
jgi:hypothetical protein